MSSPSSSAAPVTEYDGAGEQGAGGGPAPPPEGALGEADMFMPGMAMADENYMCVPRHFLASMASFACSYPPCPALIRSAMLHSLLSGGEGTFGEGEMMLWGGGGGGGGAAGGEKRPLEGGEGPEGGGPSGGQELEGEDEQPQGERKRARLEQQHR